MRLSYEQIIDVTCGASSVIYENKALKFRRFQKWQLDIYNIDIDRYNRALSSASIVLSFKTNSKFVSLNYSLKKSSSRQHGWFDVYENGVLVFQFGQNSNVEFQNQYIELSNGDKLVEIYLPWSKQTEINFMEIEDASYIIPYKRSKVLLAYGDSITQGYDAIHPSNSYINRLCSKLDAQCFNKGIGGDVFQPSLLKENEMITPDYIIVAYGTNDWNVSIPKIFYDNSREFIKRIKELYGDKKIFVIAPIWRGNWQSEDTLFGENLKVVNNYIRKLCYEYDVNYIDGFDFELGDEKYFAPDLLHPNDIGFEKYFNELYKKMKDLI